MSEWVCADCGTEFPASEKPMHCINCGSLRVITIKVAEEIAGENWRDCFKPGGVSAGE